ncbi:MAG: glycosyl transferase family 1 [Paracoccaceae bacterium]
MTSSAIAPESVAPQHMPTVQVVLAVYQPDPDHLAEQLRSIAQQNGVQVVLIAVIADTTSEPLLRQTAYEAGLEPIVVICDSPLDAVRAFEAGLVETTLINAATDAPAPLVALSDQDDIWHPDRLARGIAVLARYPQTRMVHSDATLVAEDGTTVVQKSVFAFERRHRNPGLRGLLYRNNITGMTVLMRPEVVGLALPFPRQSGVHFYHDLWLGLIAAATGGVRLIKSPLVRYRQHASNAIGAVDRQAGWLRRGQTGRRKIDAMWLRREAASYGLARYLAQTLHQRLNAAQTAGTLDPAQVRLRPLRAYLKPLGGAATHLLDAGGLALRAKLGLARIAAGFGIVNLGRSVWILRMALGQGLRGTRHAFDMRLYSLSPGVSPQMLDQDHDATDPVEMKLEALTEQRTQPRWHITLDAEAPAFTILVPTLNPTEIFAGIATALDIGLGLAARGYHVRFIATDLPVSSPAVSRGFLIQRLSVQDRATGAAERIMLQCGVTSETLPGHRADIYMATAWWSAHVAQHLIETYQLDQPRFFYLIQDFEPNFYAWGSEFADAMASYGLNFEPIFNTTLLRDYFAAQGFGFAQPDTLAFRPSIDIDHYTKTPRPETRPARRRLALYGRPEVARNMYPVALQALANFIEAEALDPDQIELVSIGMAHQPVKMPRGVTLESLGKLPWNEYPTYLGDVDVGLSLMYSPHPSHPPLEMAASGVRVVTNVFGPKDLSSLSSAITAVAPTIPDITAALSQAWHADPVPDADRQIDMTPLGQTLHGMLGGLHTKLKPILPRPPRAAAQRIILHIGSPKCGSTFLQNALLQNRKTLQQAGINYPHDGGSHPGNAADLADLTEAELDGWFAQGAHTVILSHEDLYSVARRGNALAELVKDRDIDVQLVAFMRPFSEFIYGDYSQFMKQYFDTFLAERNPYGGRDFYTFAKRRVDTMKPVAYLRKWQEHFPELPLVLASHKDIIPVISQLLPASVIAKMNWTVPRNQTNQSLRTEDCDAIAAAMRNDAMTNSEITQMYRAAFKTAGEPDNGRSKKRTDWIERQFAQHNEKLRATFSFDNTAKQSDSSQD